MENNSTITDTKIYLIELAIKIIEKGCYYDIEGTNTKLGLYPSHIGIVVKELSKELGM